MQAVVTIYRDHRRCLRTHRRRGCLALAGYAVTKIIWTILAIVFSLITLIVWFPGAVKRAYSTAGVV